MSSRMQQQMFAESQTTAYDAYQQAWRWLGVYVECKVSEADGENQVAGDEYCQRYMLWAAYVDPKYENFGVHEYQYHDPVDGWNKAACTEDSPCRRLDCHESGTNMQLLGIYKETYYSSEWFEQLFKHAGFCLWDEDTYGFMQTNYGAWPEQCTATGIAVSSENEESDASISLYMDLKPGPSLELGLYTDGICKTEYDKGDEAMVSLVSTSLGYVSPESSFQTFKDAMNVYRSCQPCRTLNLKDPEQFSCYDDAGYTNVNQCMKFRTHTTMEPATWNDIQAAAMQGALRDITIGDRTYDNKYRPSNWHGAGFLLLSGMVAIATWVFVRSRAQYRVNSNKALAEPLVHKQRRRKRHRGPSTTT